VPAKHGRQNHAKQILAGAKVALEQEHSPAALERSKGSNQKISNGGAKRSLLLFNYSVFSPHAGRHRNRNVATLATEKNATHIFFCYASLASFPKRRLMRLLVRIANMVV
jgi:hypothetical protein